MVTIIMMKKDMEYKSVYSISYIVRKKRIQKIEYNSISYLVKKIEFQKLGIRRQKETVMSNM
jgi:hypothetical protein